MIKDLSFLLRAESQQNSQIFRFAAEIAEFALSRRKSQKTAFSRRKSQILVFFGVSLVVFRIVTALKLYGKYGTKWRIDLIRVRKQQTIALKSFQTIYIMTMGIFFVNYCKIM